MTCTPEKNRDNPSLESDLQEARARIGELEKERDEWKHRAELQFDSNQTLAGEVVSLSLQVKEGRGKALEECRAIAHRWGQNATEHGERGFSPGEEMRAQARVIAERIEEDIVALLPKG
jgi:hypothetical protein